MKTRWSNLQVSSGDVNPERSIFFVVEDWNDVLDCWPQCDNNLICWIFIAEWWRSMNQELVSATHFIQDWEMDGSFYWIVGQLLRDLDDLPPWHQQLPHYMWISSCQANSLFWTWPTINRFAILQIINAKNKLISETEQSSATQCWW